MPGFYKVVRVLRHPHRLTSVFAHGEYRVEYRPGIPARGPVGKLFLFSILWSAQAYYAGMVGLPGSLEIWTCDATRVIQCPPFVLGSEYLNGYTGHAEIMEAFWRQVEFGGHSVYTRFDKVLVAPSTYLADTVTLRRKIQ